MSGPAGNSEFLFPSTLMFIEDLGETRLFNEEEEEGSIAETSVR